MAMLLKQRPCMYYVYFRSPSSSLQKDARLQIWVGVSECVSATNDSTLVNLLLLHLSIGSIETLV